MPLERQVERFEKAAGMIYTNTAGMGDDAAYRAKILHEGARVAGLAKDSPELAKRVADARALIESDSQSMAA